MDIFEIMRRRNQVRRLEWFARAGGYSPKEAMEIAEKIVAEEIGPPETTEQQNKIDEKSLQNKANSARPELGT